MVRTPSIFVFSPQGAFQFDLNQRKTPLEIPAVDEEAGCPAPVDFNECKTSCGTEQPNDDKDCKAELLASVNLNGHRIVHSNCTLTTTGCSASITLCKESNRVESLHTVDLQCGGLHGLLPKSHVTTPLVRFIAIDLQQPPCSSGIHRSFAQRCSLSHRVESRFYSTDTLLSAGRLTLGGFHKHFPPV